jgi:insertion element IS1 protein InsB
MAYHIGNREDIDAKRLWLKLPKSYRLQRHFYTDRWGSYRQVIPASQHTESKYQGKTNHIERFFCTLRQRCSRLVRKALSFSKKEENHDKAIKYFIAKYNAEIALQK